MNVFGNSLKFTSVCRAGTGRDAEADCFVECQDGYVHVMLRQLPPTSDTPPGKVRIELSVIDTGKVRNHRARSRGEGVC